MNAKSTTAVAAIALSFVVVILSISMMLWTWNNSLSRMAPVSIVQVPASRPSPVVAAPPKKRAAKPRPVKAKPGFDPAPLAQELADDNRRQLALQRIGLMAIEQPDLVAEGMTVWLAPLMNAGDYDDVLSLTAVSIAAKPQDAPAVADQQRARVIALLHEGRHAEALVAAKSYYDVVPLGDSAKGIDLVVDALNEARVKGDPAVVTRFKLQQLAGSSTDGIAVFRTIHVDASADAAAIQHAGQAADPYEACMGRGNLFLLADRPGDAMDAFQSAWKVAGIDRGRAEEIIESTARAIRAREGVIQPANEFLLDLRNGKQTIPEADPAIVRAAAKNIFPGIILPSLAVPAIERQREDGEAVLRESPSDPQIVSGFECSTPGDVRKLSPTHYEVSITTQGYRDWFMFRVVGVAGKTVRIDLTGDYVDVADKWASLNPVFTYADKLEDPATYVWTAGSEGIVAANNGPLLPATNGQPWHYIPDVWREGRRTLSFTMKFEQDRAYIAMRVPYLPSYNEAYLRELAAARSSAKLIEIGKSGQGRALLVMEIGAGTDPASKNKPCILIYAREHADEQDSSWVALGAMNFLLSDEPAARDLREHFTFLIAPMLDPDSAVISQHEVMMTTFLPGRTTPESVAWSNWFKSWVDAGNRLDVVFDLHNVQSGESPQISCPIMEGTGERGKVSEALHQMLAHELGSKGMEMSTHRWMRGLMPDRLGGWLSVTYGPITLAYEVNSQAADRHLNLADLAEMGRCFAVAAGAFLKSSDGQSLLANVDSCRQARLNRWANSPESSTGENAIESEARHAGGLSGGHEVAAGEELIP